MTKYTLFTSQNKIICQDSLVLVMRELFKAVKDNGNPVEILYDTSKQAVRFDFSGIYCDFSLFLKV